MITVKFDGNNYCHQPGESVLDTLLRHDVDVPFSCKNGVCHTCLLRRIDGSVSDIAQKGIRSTLRTLNYFMACQFEPGSNIEIALPDEASICGSVTVTDIECLAPDICKVRLQTPVPLYYHAGQYINLRRPDGLMRSYSLASTPQQDTHLEIHVRRLKNGNMSNWIHDSVRVGDELEFMGPFGECFYQPDQPDQLLVLIGTGTGLAPLIGIVRDALHSDHKGNIHLYHGSRNFDGFYLHREIKHLTEKHQNLTYTPCLSGDVRSDECKTGRADEIAFSDFTDLKATRLFLCGHPDMVRKAKKTAYLNGASLDQIHADPFELTDLRKQPRG